VNSFSHQYQPAQLFCLETRPLLSPPWSLLSVTGLINTYSECPQTPSLHSTCAFKGNLHFISPSAISGFQKLQHLVDPWTTNNESIIQPNTRQSHPRSGNVRLHHLGGILYQDQAPFQRKGWQRFDLVAYRVSGYVSSRQSPTPQMGMITSFCPQGVFVHHQHEDNGPSPRLTTNSSTWPT